MSSDIEKNARVSLTQLASSALQFGLAMCVLQAYRLESRALIELLILAWFGFIVHALLPLRLRLAFFTALSIGGTLWTLGPSAGAWAVGLGGVVLALCHLPGPSIVRVGALIAVALGLGAVRHFDVETPWSPAVWPILASMFMFRVIIYLYDLEHARERPKPTWSLAYFFMLPNVCFPLFPVVDFKKFRAGHYSEEAAVLYQRGAYWMLRGLLHLLLYRCVYFNFTLAPDEVVSASTLLRYMLATFLLYLRVSGHFHFIVGMLLMFGFNLPATNHLYFLASSFNDYWRRINIYWKDFMMKIVFYPAFFKLRKFGEVKALAVATVATFATTASLHFYQAFWVRGAPCFSWTEVIYWGILAVLVVANSLYERRYGKQRAVDDGRFTWYGAGARALRIVMTFSIMCVLWALWDLNTFDDWLQLWRAGGAAWQWFVGGIVAAGLLATALQRRHRAAPSRPRPSSPVPNLMARPAFRIAVVAVIGLLGNPEVHRHLGSDAVAIVRQLRDRGLNRRDQATQNRGYYEHLHHLSRLNPELQQIFNKRPQDWVLLADTEAYREVDNFVGFELVPNSRITFKRKQLAVNSHGLRDREYEKTKPPGVYRIAVLGASAPMGSGVSNDEIFEALLEERLNRESAGGPLRYEWLNFAVGGYSPLVQPWLIDHKVLEFSPDAVVYVAHRSDRTMSSMALLERLQSGRKLPAPWLRDLAATTDITPTTGAVQGERETNRIADELIFGIYRQMVESCRARGVAAVCVILPLVRQAVSPLDEGWIIDTVRRSGFELWDLTDVYDGRVLADLRVAEWDTHPNAKGHRLIADRLYTILAGDQRTIPFPRAQRPSPQASP